MDAKHLLLAHGDKLAIGLLALGCGYLVISDLTDEGIRPEGGLTVASISATVNDLNELRPRLSPPTLKPPVDYPSQMRANLGRSLPTRPLLANLTQHPDLGKDEPMADRYLTAFELLGPAVVVKDAIGQLELTVALPAGIRPPGDRLQDGTRGEWKRNEVKAESRGRAGKAEEVVNSAEIVGVLIEWRTGDAGAWVALAAPGVQNGCIRAEDLGKPVLLANVKPSETYTFRARAICKATGIDLVEPVNSHGDVLVALTRLAPEGTVLSPADWKALIAQILNKDPEVLKRFLPGQPAAIGPFVPGPSERLYRGEPGREVSITVKPDFRITLTGITPDPENPDKPRARVLLQKFLRDPAAGRSGWLKAPVEYKLGVGDPLGKQENLDIPTDDPDTRKKPVDLTTPYKLVKIEEGATRVIYFELKLNPRAGGGKGRDLEFRPVTRPTDVATFQDTKTGQLLKLVKATAIQRQANAIVTPEVPLALDERQVFQKDPAHFEFAPLAPEEPKRHKPGTGPLEELRTGGNVLAVTDTDYFELPDGRLIYWESINNKVETLWKPGTKPVVAKPQVTEMPTVPADAPASLPTDKAPAPAVPPAEAKPALSGAAPAAGK